MSDKYVNQAASTRRPLRAQFIFKHIKQQLDKTRPAMPMTIQSLAKATPSAPSIPVSAPPVSESIKLTASSIAVTVLNRAVTRQRSSPLHRPESAMKSNRPKSRRRSAKPSTAKSRRYAYTAEDGTSTVEMTPEVQAEVSLVLSDVFAQSDFNAWDADDDQMLVKDSGAYYPFYLAPEMIPGRSTVATRKKMELVQQQQSMDAIIPKRVLKKKKNTDARPPIQRASRRNTPTVTFYAGEEDYEAAEKDTLEGDAVIDPMDALIKRIVTSDDPSPPTAIIPEKSHRPTTPSCLINPPYPVPHVKPRRTSSGKTLVPNVIPLGAHLSDVHLASSIHSLLSQQSPSPLRRQSIGASLPQLPASIIQPALRSSSPSIVNYRPGRPAPPAFMLRGLPGKTASIPSGTKFEKTLELTITPVKRQDGGQSKRYAY